MMNYIKSKIFKILINTLYKKSFNYPDKSSVTFLSIITIISLCFALFYHSLILGLISLLSFIISQVIKIKLNNALFLYRLFISYLNHKHKNVEFRSDRERQILLFCNNEPLFMKNDIYGKYTPSAILGDHYQIENYELQGSIFIKQFYNNKSDTLQCNGIIFSHFNLKTFSMLELEKE